jgi:transposase
MPSRKIMEKHYFRVLLLHYWKQNLKATEATQKICQVEGEGVLSVHTTRKWFKKFNDGDTSLEDEPRSGRPVTVDSGALLERVEANPATSTRRLLAETGASKSTVHRKLIELGKVNRRCRVVPHELTQKKRRFSAFFQHRAFFNAFFQHWSSSQLNFFHIQLTALIFLLRIFTFFGRWKISLVGGASQIWRRSRMVVKNSSPQKIRSGITMGSNNWQKDGLRP